MSASSIVFDTIIQSSTVELLHSHGVAAAPLSVSTAPRSSRSRLAVVGFASFQSTKLSGSLSLSLDVAVFEVLRGEATGQIAEYDALAALTSELALRIRKSLMRFNIALRIGPTSVLDTDALGRTRASSDNDRVYVVRTLRGDVFVTASATFDDAALTYSSALHGRNDSQPAGL